MPRLSKGRESFSSSSLAEDGSFVPMTSDWAALPEQLEYSWASASRDILSRTIDVDYDKIDIGQLR